MTPSSELLSLIRALAGNPHDCCWSHLPFSSSSSSSSSSEEITTCTWITEVYVACPPCSVDAWERPEEWPDITEMVAGIVGLIAVEDTTMEVVALLCEGSYTVDWGDGSATEDFASGVKAEHSYDYATLSGDVLSYGYKTAIVSVTAQEGSSLTLVDFQQKHSATGSTYPLAKWLDVAMNIPACESLTFGSAYEGWRRRVSMGWVQRVTVTSHALTDMSNLFEGCYALASVELADTAAVTTTNSMFSRCASLPTIPLVDLSAVTDAAYMFEYCHGLVCLPELDTSQVEDMSGMFSHCGRLLSLPDLNIGQVSSLLYAFEYCASLPSLPVFDMSSLVSAEGMLFGCSALSELPTMDMPVVEEGGSFASLCTSLYQTTGLNMGSLGTVYAMFEYCTTMTQVPILDLSSIWGASSMTNFLRYADGVNSSAVHDGVYRIDYSYKPLSAAAINEIFTNLGTAAGTQTITITNCPGAATCDRSIATAKGWTVVG